MASHAIAARPVAARPATAVKAPPTFQDALKQGWAVVSDNSHQSINQKRREGRLTMQKKGCAGLLERANKRDGFLLLTNGKASSKTLMVRYTALYELGEPYFLEARS